jgi:hypothetical protein
VTKDDSGRRVRVGLLVDRLAPAAEREALGDELADVVALRSAARRRAGPRRARPTQA